jgi:hypothetical protein
LTLSASTAPTVTSPPVAIDGLMAKLVQAIDDDKAPPA